MKVILIPHLNDVSYRRVTEQSEALARDDWSRSMQGTESAKTRTMKAVMVNILSIDRFLI